jgi:AcrR family transcriptional regulator
VAGRSSKRVAAQTATRIRRAALELFAERGFAGASTHEIARAAAVNQGLIRHHFAGKEPLWRAVVESELTELVTDLERACSSAEHAVATPQSMAELSRALMAHAALVQLIVHALLEPGARRQWLIVEQLGPLWRRAVAWFGRNSQGPLDARDHEVLLWSWAAAALAVPCLGAALAELSERPLAVGVASRVQAEILERCAMLRPAATSHGPWSVPAAVRRRLGLGAVG